MPDLLLKDGTQVRFVVAGSFAPAVPGTNWSSGTPVDVALSLSGVAANAGRQSAKIDLGASRPPTYDVLGCVDFNGRSPTSGATVDYYWAPSSIATPGSGNVAGNNGTDAAAGAGAIPGGLTLNEFIGLCDPIGSLHVSDDATVQNGYVGRFSPTRYGQLVVVNRGGDDFAMSNAEAHQVFVPVIPAQ